MGVVYSGYNGVNNKLGNEYIEITTETSVDMKMKVFAYASGEAKVLYSWERSESPCCKGEALCHGESFSRALEKNQNVEVGVIPAGKINVTVTLTADEDLDVQLYDTTVTDRFPDGKAIIGWCDKPKTCNFGILNGHSLNSTVYQGVKYTYSGYNGGGTSGTLGNEFIRIEGTTNRPLMMKAFSYAKGEANIEYSYLEPKQP